MTSSHGAADSSPMVANPSVLDNPKSTEAPRDVAGHELRKASVQPDKASGSFGGGIDKSVLAISEPRRYRDKAHLKFVASQACLICGREQSDPHHLGFAQPRALGRKVSDEYVVPLCRTHHREVHRSSKEINWWKKYNIDPLSVASTLWARTHPVWLADQPTSLDQTAGARPETSGSTSDAPASQDPRNRKTKPIVAAGGQ